MIWSLWLLNSFCHLATEASTIVGGEDSTFAPLAVDETFTASEVFPSNSLLECAALCQVNINCTVMYFNSADKTCSSIKRDSVTWDNPTKTIFVESGYEFVCPNDFSYYYPPSNACFQMFNESMQWQDAKSFCEAKPGAQLASILNQAENQFTLGLPRASEHIWIGGNDIASEGSYKWTDGTSINYKPWVLHQPSDSDGSQDCIASQSNGWHDQICTIEYLVLCRRSYN